MRTCPTTNTMQANNNASRQQVCKQAAKEDNTQHLPLCPHHPPPSTFLLHPPPTPHPCHPSTSAPTASHTVSHTEFHQFSERLWKCHSRYLEPYETLTHIRPPLTPSPPPSLRGHGHGCCHPHAQPGRRCHLHPVWSARRRTRRRRGDAAPVTCQHTASEQRGREGGRGGREGGRAGGIWVRVP